MISKLARQGVYIIAEVANAAQGIVQDNHRIIDAAADAGADAIKFQFYKYDELATPYYAKYENFRRTFYTEDERRGFVDHAYERGLDVVVDIFDRWGLGLVRKLEDKIYAVKIPSAVILDEELVDGIAVLGKRTFVGVGGYGDDDIDFMLGVLQKYTSDIVLLHGFQGFPTDAADSSLARIEYLKRRYNLPVGYADHIDAETPLALRMPEYAYYAGASVIEKHITLDRASKGLDYYSSLLPDEFRAMVQNVRVCEMAMGSEEGTSVEKEYVKHSTRLTAVRDINPGELISDESVNFRRTDNQDAMFPNVWSAYGPAVAAMQIKKDQGIAASDLRPARIGIIVGCRMHSTRLPKKALLEINGVPSIERCLLNCLASERAQMTVLATSTHPDDDVLKDYTVDGRAKFFRGAEDDLAQRILDAAREFDLDVVVRVTGDRPLISSELVDYLLDSHIRRSADFSCFSNVPLGINPEVITVAALQRLKGAVDTEKYSEYLTTFFKNNPKYFHINEVEPPREYRYPEYRLVLDHPEDLELMREIYGELDVGAEPIQLRHVFTLLRDKPELAAINQSIKPKYVDSEFATYLNEITRIREGGAREDNGG